MKIMKKYIIKEKVIIITNFNYFATDKIKKILFHISNRDNILLKNNEKIKLIRVIINIKTK
jgi:hypothetical protein